MKRALVLSGTSFVGRHLCRLLERRGWQVIATSRQARPPAHEVCDLTNRSEVHALLKRTQPANVFQCSGATAFGSAEALYQLHVLGTLHVLTAVAEHMPSAPLVLFGSAAEYGASSMLPISEDHPPLPMSFFGASKLAQTELARAAAAEHQLRVLAVRPFNIIGPGIPEHYLVGALIRRLRDAIATGEGGTLPVANGTATRDLVDVRDVAEAVLGLIERAVPAPGSLDVYNIATGIETPVRAVAEHLCQRAGRCTVMDQGTSTSRSNIYRSCGDPSRLIAATGWQPHISWEQSLDDAWRDLAVPAGD